jgi:hypothetical protein
MLHLAWDESVTKALLTEGLVTQDQLSKARKLLDQLDGQKTVGEVLVEMNWVSGQRLDEFARRHRSIGEILVARRLVTERDIAAAREIQRKTAPRSKRLGETLIEMGLIEERHVIEALADKF